MYGAHYFPLQISTTTSEVMSYGEDVPKLFKMMMNMKNTMKNIQQITLLQIAHPVGLSNTASNMIV
jgi:hypothetical protein